MRTTANYEKIGLVAEACRCRRIAEDEHDKCVALTKENEQLKQQNEHLARLVKNYKLIMKIKGIQI